MHRENCLQKIGVILVYGGRNYGGINVRIAGFYHGKKVRKRKACKKIKTNFTALIF